MLRTQAAANHPSKECIIVIDNLTVGKAIASLRIQKKLSQQALADLCSVTHQAVSKWENGMALPDMQTMLFLSKFFQVSMEDILTGTLPTQAEKEMALPPQAPPEEPKKHSSDCETLQDAANFQCEDCCCDAEQQFSPMGWEEIMGLAPFASKKTLDQLVKQKLQQGSSMDRGMLMGLIPFISREMTEELCRQCINRQDSDFLFAIAPFVGREFLGNAVKSIPDAQQRLQAVMGLIPFLPKETADEWILQAARSSNAPQPQNPHSFKQPEAEPKERPLMRIARKAVADDNESWLCDHAENLTAAEMNQLIDPLSDKGKWNVLLEMAVHMENAALSHLIQNGIQQRQWDFLTEIAAHADGPALRSIIQGAIDQQKWSVLEEIAVYADDFAELIAAAAGKAGQWDLLENILGYLPRESLQQMLDEAIRKSNWDMINRITEYLA